MLRSIGLVLAFGILICAWACLLSGLVFFRHGELQWGVFAVGAALVQTWRGGSVLWEAVTE